MPSPRSWTLSPTTITHWVSSSVTRSLHWTTNHWLLHTSRLRREIWRHTERPRDTERFQSDTLQQILPNCVLCYRTILPAVPIPRRVSICLVSMHMNGVETTISKPLDIPRSTAMLLATIFPSSFQRLDATLFPLEISQINLPSLALRWTISGLEPSSTNGSRKQTTMVSSPMAQW